MSCLCKRDYNAEVNSSWSLINPVEKYADQPGHSLVDLITFLLTETKVYGFNFCYATI